MGAGRNKWKSQARTETLVSFYYLRSSWYDCPAKPQAFPHTPGPKVREAEG